MTLAMPDSVNVNDLPVGYDAYLGYTDGNFRTSGVLRVMFPDAELVLLTVTGGTAGAHGARVAPGTDTEPGDLTAEAAVRWASKALGAPGPVLYASVIGTPGYGMADVLVHLEAAGIARRDVRLLSAHYGQGPHICGPASCGAIGTDMDGTQWTDAFTTPAGKTVDMSMLANGFFEQLPVQTETERLVTELGTVRHGAIGEVVKTVQGLCNARGADGHIGPLAIDGVFGLKTETAVVWFQHQAGITTDGIVGPQTWPVLLGVA